MPFYDIMLLYRMHEDLVKEENDNQEKLQQQYEQQNATQPQLPNFNDYKVPDFNSISRGMFDGAKSNFNFNIPGFS